MTDWSLPPEVQQGYGKELPLPPPPALLSPRFEEAWIAKWGYTTLYATTGLVVYPLSLLTIYDRGPSWRKFDSYLKKKVPEDLHHECILADGRWSRPRGLYITCLVRMLPLFGLVWVTKRINDERKRREALGDDFDAPAEIYSGLKRLFTSLRSQQMQVTFRPSSG
ncbi:uncharacterized protein PG998_009085 [Apiospora kogelbergensis]|uniref:uncharacterized protein n=1 Tax=Apiospora kogelbergensis TaxID=1337665 RepID=UPI0031320913